MAGQGQRTPPSEEKSDDSEFRAGECFYGDSSVMVALGPCIYIHTTGPGQHTFMADNGPPATWFAFTADAPWKNPKTNPLLQGQRTGFQQIKGQRSMISLIPQEHRELQKQRSQTMQRSKSQIFYRPGEALDLRNESVQQVYGRRSRASPRLSGISEVREDGSPQVNGWISKTTLRTEEVSEAPKSEFQQLTYQTSTTSLGRQTPRTGQSNISRQIEEQKSRKSLRSEAPERSKFFVCVQDFPSWYVLAKGAVLTNAVFYYPAAKLYEFVFPPCYKPVFLWLSLWQKRSEAPEYYVQLLDGKRYVPEPIVILREAHQDAAAGRSWRATSDDEQAVHIASCHRETVIRLVKGELRRKLEYCVSKYEKAEYIKKYGRKTFRDIRESNHKLMEMKVDCAGEKGAGGATWLFDRLESYFEFIGMKDGDEAVLKAFKSVVDDIKKTTNLMSGSPS